MITALLLLLPQLQEERVTAEVLFNQDHARPGDTVWAAVDLKIQGGWHVYGPEKQEGATPTVAEVTVAGAKAGTLKWSDTHLVPDGVFKGMTVYEGDAAIGVPLDVARDAKGEIKVTFKVTYQACNDSVCENLKTVEATGTLAIGEGEPKSANPSIFKSMTGKAKPPAATQSATERYAQEELEKRGLIGILLFAASGGLISLIMPCVYPLIPITLNYFMHQGGGSRSKGLALSGVYALGVVLSFTGIGFAMALAIGPHGAQVFASNPWVNLAVAAMFLAFAISFFGLFEIALPASLTQKLAGGGPKSGLGGAFLLGILFSVVTFTCTIPIAGTVLGLAANASHRWAGLLSMLAYSATMALPFFALGAFPSMLKTIPRSGGWLHTVKVTTAFLELALAMQYVANADLVWKWGVLTRKVMVGVWVGALALMALYLLNVFSLFLRREGDAPRFQFSLTRLLFAALFVAGAGFFATGFDGRPLGFADLVLPPATKVARPPDFAMLPPALLASKERQQPVFLEFTGAQ